MDEGHAMTPFDLELLLPLLQSPRKAVTMSIDIFIGGIVAQIISNKKISCFFDWIDPGQSQLIVSFVEFGLKRPLEV